MADIAAGDVTYSIQSKAIGESGYRTLVVGITFGDGALTYPSGGIPLTKGKMGCPNEIRSFRFIDENSGSSLGYKYDKTNNKLRIYNSTGSHTHSLFLNNAEVADGATTRVNAGTDLLGANTGTDISVAGVADTTGHGGIVSSAASEGSEVASGSFAPAATTIYAEVMGW